MSVPRRIEVPRTARYFLEDGGSPTRAVWFLLHGYGQLAEAFLAEFAPLARPGTLFVAPEALSRYYLSRGRGTVGASWMTREERADEIQDTVRYLDRVWSAVAREHRLASSVPLRVLGFSQGGAAAARWAVLGAAPVRSVLSYACPLPPDLDLAQHRDRVQALEWTFALGDADRTIDPSAHAAGLTRLREAGVEPAFEVFPGVHELHRATLERLLVP